MKKLAKKLVVLVVPAAMLCTGMLLTAPEASAKPGVHKADGKRKGKRKRGKFKKFLKKLKNTPLWAKWGSKLQTWRGKAKTLLRGCRAMAGDAKTTCRKRAKGWYRSQLKRFKQAYRAFRAKRRNK